jgi:hypothetical protein
MATATSNTIVTARERMAARVSHTSSHGSRRQPLEVDARIARW